MKVLLEEDENQYHVDCWGIAVLAFMRHLFCLIKAPWHKRSDASNLGRPKNNHKSLLLNGKVKVLDLIRKEKNHFAEVAKIYGKNVSSINEIMRREK